MAVGSYCTIWACLGQSPKLVHREEHGLVFILVVASTVIFIDSLQGYVASIVLDQAERRCDRHHVWQEEIQIATAGFFPFGEDTIEDTEELKDAFLTTSVSSSRMLDCKRVYAPIVAAHLQTAMREPNGPNEVNVGEEALNRDEVLIFIAVLQVLARYLHRVKLLELELAQMWAVVLQTLRLWSAIKLFFEFVSPFPQLVDVLIHRRLLEHKVFFKRASNVGW